MSRHGDPDRSLEHLLRQSRPDPPSVAGPDCLDAERLAAWSSGALAASERPDLEHHLSNCARCQALLAAFVRSGDAPVVPAWRGLSARWLVPVALGAAATVFWMTRPVPSPAGPPPADTMARVEQAPASPPSASFAEPAPATPAEAETAQLKARAGNEVGRQEAREAQAASGPLPAAPPAAPQAMADRVERPSAVTEETALLTRPAPQGPEIVAPDPQYRWRIRGAVVERSTTGGASWTPTERPSGTVVTAGASPAPLVCWLVGPSGTVLRTVDGVRFESRNVAGAGALRAIRADDADRATVTAADGRVFSTTDGGQTWR